MAIDLQDIERKLIEAKASQFEREHKFSRKAAMAAAAVVVEEQLNEGVTEEALDAFFNGLTEDRKLNLVRLIRQNVQQAPSGRKPRKRPEGGNPGVARGHWMRNTNYTDDKKLDKFVKDSGFESFQQFYASPDYKKHYQQAKASKK